jgi:hypothetical protein
MDVDEDAELHARFDNDPVTQFIEPGMDDAVEGDDMDQSPSSSAPSDAGELLAVSGDTAALQPDPYVIPFPESNGRTEEGNQIEQEAQHDAVTSDARSSPVVIFMDQDVPSAQDGAFLRPSSPGSEYQESVGGAQSSSSSDRYETPPEQSRAQPGFETDYTADDVPVVVVKGDGLNVMLKAMGGPKWCGLGPGWINDFNKTIDNFSACGEAERKFKQWSKSHTRNLSPDLRRMFESSLGLMALFKLAPRLFEQTIAAQQAYFATEDSQEELRSSVDMIGDAVDSFCNLTASSKRKQAAKDTARKAIPMLLLTLRYAFIMGSQKDPFPSRIGTQEEEGSDAEPLEDDETIQVQRSRRKVPKPDLGIRESAFPRDLLLCLASISSWIEKLHAVMMRWLQADETDNDRQHLMVWKNLGKHIRGLHDSIDYGLAKLEEDDLEAQELRIQLSREKDYRAKAEREAKARKLREASDRQMEFFFASTQGMGGLQRRSLIFPQRRSYRPSTMILPIDTARTARLQNRRKRKSSAKVYQEDNHGWSWDDDNSLLHTIRRVRRPSMEGLRGLLPDHSIGEIKRRILDLKEKSRTFYEARGIPPPEWCYVG